ncbi:hypothetical protein FOZ60_010851 [Perkinsus olseni]|uniref:Uncharacterized protein n=1 Tax=Perkinsus olseni TaxID=32597 RepID=A0A7J6PDH6_PEROL|nr:hypothetical protein FOZ60_010851 [Perkinsus olseni]
MPERQARATMLLNSLLMDVFRVTPVTTALVTVVACGITIIPMYAPPTPDPWYLPMLLSGPGVALVAFLDLRTYTLQAISAAFSVFLGLGAGALVHYIYDVASGGKLQSSKCKLGDFTFATFATAFPYIPVGLYLQRPYAEAWVTELGVILGALSPSFVMLILAMFGLIPSPGLPMTKRLPFAAADFFDLLTGYFICARDHNNAIQAQADDFNEVCHAAAKQKIPARLSAVFWNMAGELFLPQRLSAHPGARAGYHRLRMEAVSGRLFARGVPEEADRDLSGRIASCEQLMVDVISDVNRRAAEGSISPPSTAAIVQFYYAVGAILYIAGLAEKYRCTAVVDKEEEEKRKQERRDQVIRVVVRGGDGLLS